MKQLFLFALKALLVFKAAGGGFAAAAAAAPAKKQASGAAGKAPAAAKPSAPPSGAHVSGSYITVEKVLFPLGEEMISLSDGNQAKKKLKAGLFPPNLLIFAVFPVKTLLSENQALEDFLIAQKIIDISLKEEGEASGFQPDPKSLQKSYQRIQGKSSSKGMRKRLRAAGLSSKIFRAETAQSLKRDFFIRQNFAAKIIISDSEIDGRFLQTQGGAAAPEEVFEFRFISFERTDEGLKQARAAEKALPQSFETRFKSGKGDKQRLKSGEISPPIEKALQGLSVSQFSPLTPIGDKIYIFKLDWKAPVWPAAAERERQKIRAELLQEALRESFKQWLKEKKSLYSLSRLKESA